MVVLVPILSVHKYNPLDKVDKLRAIFSVAVTFLDSEKTWAPEIENTSMLANPSILSGNSTVSVESTNVG